MKSRTESQGRDYGRLFLFFLLCAPLALVTVHDLANGNDIQSDFTIYWAAGRLLLQHQNPYSAAATYAVEKAQGWRWEYWPFHYPPWSLWLIIIFGKFSLYTARTAWFALSLVLMVLSAFGLWRYFGGEKRQWWVPALLLLTFVPFGAVEHMGQITPLMLVSLTSFLLLERAGYQFLAGISLLGMSFKPQLLWLVFIAIALWAMKNKNVRFLCGAALSLTIAWLVALAFDPKALHFVQDSYGETMGISCGVGGALRLWFGVDHRWLQYVPCVGGAGWFLWYWEKNVHEWEWSRHIPLLGLVSLLSSPYFWYHDIVLVLPTFVAVAARGGYRSILVVGMWFLIQMSIVIPQVYSYQASLQSVLSLLWVGFWFLSTAVLKGENEREFTVS